MKKLLANNIKKYYGEDDCIVKAVDDISLEIECGKSTLLHCMAGLDKPTFGNVYLGENDIYTLSDDELSRIRRQEFGFIFQSFNLIPVLNVYDNIVLPIHLDNKKEDEAYINNLIVQMGLEDQIKKYPNELSGGQQQRVAIARALSNKPSVIFADEPTGNLDSKTTDEVMEILTRAVSEFNQTLVMITHDNEIAKRANRIITIRDGKILEDN